MVRSNSLCETYRVRVRLPVDLTANIDVWAESQEVSRSEAIRLFVELGLKVKGK
jgi:metal-responsive CopG/Arc/MetJ family transcriptional regulator